MAKKHAMTIMKLVYTQILEKGVRGDEVGEPDLSVAGEEVEEAYETHTFPVPPTTRSSSAGGKRGPLATAPEEAAATDPAPLVQYQGGMIGNSAAQDSRADLDFLLRDACVRAGRIKPSGYEGQKEAGNLFGYCSFWAGSARLGCGPARACRAGNVLIYFISQHCFRCWLSSARLFYHRNLE